MVRFYLKKRDSTFFIFIATPLRIHLNSTLLVLPFSPLIYLNKILYTAVKGPFNRIREVTCGQLMPASMVTEAFATDTLPAT